jgi:hypothetical protein
VRIKALQYAARVFVQVSARPGNQLENLYPGAGEVWRRYVATTRTPLDAS